jgi:small conductance mechanosensitive channel
MNAKIERQAWLERAAESATELVSTWGLRVLGAFAVLFVGWMAAKVVRRAADRALGRTRIDRTLVPFLTSIVYYLVMLVTLIAALGLVGIQTASVVAVLGAAGLAVGLALQGTLSHFASGVMLLYFRPIRVGDFVDIAGTVGTVAEVGLFATTLNTPDNVRIITPNSSIWGQTIKNYWVNANRRVDLVIGVSYGDDLQVAADVIRKTVADHELVLSDPEPQVAVSALADSSVNFVVRPWCRKEDYWTVRFETLERVKAALEAAGCTIPFPQRDVHLQQPVA